MITITPQEGMQAATIDWHDWDKTFTPLLDRGGVSEKFVRFSCETEAINSRELNAVAYGGVFPLNHLWRVEAGTSVMLTSDLRLNEGGEFAVTATPRQSGQQIKVLF